MTMEPDYKDDLVLAGEVKKGNEKAFDYLFRTRYARMCRLAVTFINDKTVAEDIVQEVFSTVWQHARRVNERRSIDGYLFTSVKNACLNHLRDARHHVSLDVLPREETPAEAPPETDDPRVKHLWQVIEGLPLQCKIIFKLVVIEEMKYHEVAARMELSVNTVKTQIKIAYKTLRQKMGPY
ncbi:MAG: RNA polymerase sigma-70 factor [Odoribacteraceae bacterium]|jgi:RNA polymerase sigma-70 factor (ECF subfamily)|nr:RNA polymerase sigma-70 factor [Odoribacteraceae bacterium]